MTTDEQHHARWPNGAKAAVSFTMDNLGEAQDVNRGLWPADRPVGTDASVREQLPRILDLLDRHGIRATYFAEAWSLGPYADVARREILGRGHELAWHGYQHEPWAALSAADEELNFSRSREAMGEFAKGDGAGGEDGGAVFQYRGFRPPGGTVNGERTYELLRRHGVSYISPLGKGVSVERGVTVLPFDWRAVDAFYYMEGEKFTKLRREYGEPDPEAVLGPSRFRDFLQEDLRAVVREGGYRSVLFHPFLQTSEEKFAVLDGFLGRLAGNSDIWCAPCDEVARWVQGHPELFGSAERNLT